MALINPVVTWYTRDNAQNVTMWDLQTVDAGGDPVETETGFLIWNNRGNSVDTAKTMTECTITTRSADPGKEGTLDSIIVKEEWVEVRVDSMGEDIFTKIGAKHDPTEGKWVSDEKAIKATGSGAGSQEIKGDVNDGSKANAQNNFSEVTLRMAVPTTAPAGNLGFLVRVYYKYV